MSPYQTFDILRCFARAAGRKSREPDNQYHVENGGWAGPNLLPPQL